MKAAVVDLYRDQSKGVSQKIPGLLRIALSAVFIGAGVSKYRDLANFEVILIHWQMFPDEILSSLVWGVPLVEILAGWACLSTRWRGAGVRFLLFLTTTYTLLLLVEWFRGISADCGCFGATSSHWSYQALLLRNLALIMIEFLVVVSTSLDAYKRPNGFADHGGCP